MSRFSATTQDDFTNHSVDRRCSGRYRLNIGLTRATLFRGSGTRGAAKSALGILYVDNELRKADNSAPVRRMGGRLSPRGRRTRGMVAGGKKCSRWYDKSNFHSGRCAEPRPIVAFYIQSRVKLWRGEGGAVDPAGPLYRLLAGSIIVPLAPA